MASDTRARKSRSRSSRSVRYFFVNGDLHKSIRVIRAADLIEAWNYRLGKSVSYVFSDVRKRMERAFSLQETCKMVGRHRVQVERYILEGKIRTPQRIYSLDGQNVLGKYFFSESDVLELHDYLLTVHIGRPRNDGKITPGKMPTKSELRAIMKHDIVTYIKTDDDEFLPTWKEIDW